jgi:hypothetical protein
MSLAGDAVVYILILIAVLAVVAGIMYAVGHTRKPAPEEPPVRATSADQEARGQEPGTQQTADQGR